MGTHLMFGNGKGWEKGATHDDGDNVGHAADSVGICLPDGCVALERGDALVCRTKRAKSIVNKALYAQGWVAYTEFNIRKKDGAVITITRNYVDNTGQWVVARFERTH